MNSSSNIYISLVVFVLSLRRISADTAVGTFYADERGALIQLRDSLSSIINLHSNWTGPPCYNGRSRWIGIACSDSHIIGIALEGIQLTGSLQPNALQNLTYLTNLSLTNNSLHGVLPTLKGLDRLRAVSFSHNRFAGSIPIEFVSLPQLLRLELEDNLLNGSIPAFDQQTLTVFNVSYNFLEGQIPKTPTLQRFPSSSFDHNLELCGNPLEKQCPVAPPSIPPSISPPSRSSGKELKLWSLVLIALGALMVPFLAILCFLCYCKRFKKAKGKGDVSGEASSEIAEKRAGGLGSGAEGERIVELEFFDKERPAFDLDDLLRSSAEVMGKGRLGTTYRTTLESGPVVVVKRLRDMSGVSKKEFVQQLQLIGRVRHENIVETISYYYSKDEKLVVYEDVPGGSLFNLLHDNRGRGRVPLNWAARLCIVRGIAKGLSYLHHSLPSHKVPHANLKTSNVLILHDTHHPNYHPKLADFGFLPLLPSPDHSRKLAVGKTPEFSQGRKLTHKADIYCFGLLLLEIITGQVPSDDDEEDLAEWVRSAASTDWSTDILDLEIVAEKEGHDEMLRLTEIALECTAVEPDRRPKMSELVRRIEDIREFDSEERT